MSRAPNQGARAKLRLFLLAHVGQTVRAETLREISGGKSEWARRVRELRNEEGYQILSHNDRSDLKPDEYILTSAKPAPAFERAISKEVRALVLDRNGFTCQMCGAAAGEEHPHDKGRKTRLHIGHVLDKSMGGTDDPANLRALCPVCNEGAANITPVRPDALKLLAQIRRAATLDQIEVLKFLLRKFPAPSNQ